MIPTMAASTGAAFRFSASPAARPSRTTSTFSCTPAPTLSTASSATPRGVSSRFSGCTSNSFAPSNFRCFWVETTVPTTRAICIRGDTRHCRIAGLQDCRKEWQDCRKEGPKEAFRTSLSAILQFCNSAISRFQVPVVDDANDTGIDGRFDGIVREAGFLASYEEHDFAHASADGIDGDERPAGRLAFRRQRLHDEQRQARQTFVLASDHDVADHAGQVHQSVTSTVSTMPTIAASTGVSFRPDAI